MPIPVTIDLTQEAKHVHIYDHFSNDEELIEDQDSRKVPECTLTR